MAKAGSARGRAATQLGAYNDRFQRDMQAPLTGFMPESSRTPRSDPGSPEEVEGFCPATISSAPLGTPQVTPNDTSAPESGPFGRPGTVPSNPSEPCQSTCPLRPVCAKPNTPYVTRATSRWSCLGSIGSWVRCAKPRPRRHVRDVRHPELVGTRGGICSSHSRVAPRAGAPPRGAHETPSPSSPPPRGGRRGAYETPSRTSSTYVT